MAFPVVEATNTSVTAVAGTTHTVSLPASISAGDLLIIFIRAASNFFSTPSGWTFLESESLNGYSFVVYKIADGTEGASVNITSTGSTKTAHNSYRISGANPTNPIASIGATNTIDPPSLNGQFGVDDLLWLVMASTDRTDNTFSAPTNYTNAITAETAAASSDTGNVRLSTARRSLNALSEDPGTWGSTGTLDNPHAITLAIRPVQADIEVGTWAELAEINNGYLNRDIVLTADLDENSPGYDTYAGPSANSGAGWIPLGNWDTYQFNGSFDGQGHTISGLYIDDDALTEIGLFGAADGTNQIIQDLGVLNINMSSTGSFGGGGLLGSCYSNTMKIKNCYVSGGSIHGSDYVGGFGGDIEGPQMFNCWADVSVSSIDDYAGGFIGYVYLGRIENCYALGDVACGDDYGGGFCGIDSSVGINNYARGNVTGNSILGGFAGSVGDRAKMYCYATGTVTGSGHNLGGFCGELGHDALGCYAIGRVEGTDQGDEVEYSIGGFVGYWWNGDCVNCFALGDVYSLAYWGVGGFFGESDQNPESARKCFCIGQVDGGASAIGGFSGYSSDPDQAIDCFWNTETSGQATSDTGIPATTAEMKTLGLYTTLTGTPTTDPITVTRSGAAVTTIAGGTGGSGETDQQKGQSFTATGTVIASVQLKFWKWGTPTDNIICTITSSLGGASLGSKSVDATSFSAGALVTFTFDTPINVTNGNTYYIQLSRSGARDAGNACAVYFRYNTNPYAGGSMWRRDNNVWAADGGTSHDFAMVITHADGVLGLFNEWEIVTGKDVSEKWGINASQ